MASQISLQTRHTDLTLEKYDKMNTQAYISLSELRIRSRCRQLESTMFIDPNRGQGKYRSKAGRGPYSMAESGWYRTAGRLRVRACRMVRTGKTREQNLRKQGDGKTHWEDLTSQTGNRQTENTAINTLGTRRKMGDTWRGWRQSKDR
jgi:hypothetical protein